MKIGNWPYMAAFLATIAASHWAFAQSPSELQFTSRYDKFQLQRSGSRYLLDGKSVQLGPFEQFLDLFKSEIEGDCSVKGRPDLTVQAKIGENSVERKFYIADRIVSDGKQCATVNGEGIYFVPLHQSWFDPSAKMTIAVRSPFKVKKGDEVLGSFEQAKGEWKNALAGDYPNWEFFSAFRDSLREFTISHRAHAAAAKDKPSFTVQSGDKRYVFYKLGATLWVAQIPGTPWLVGSSRWTSWVDMEKSQWMDRFGPQLTMITDKSKDLTSRRGTLATLEGQNSPSIREVLTRILLDESEASELKTDAVRLLKQSPSIENMGVMVRALKTSDNAELLEALSRALRVRNPKGPVITPDMDGSAKQKSIREWQQWWQSASHGSGS